MLKLILQTIRIFVDGGWDDSPGWFEYLFDSARLVGITPQELEAIAVIYRNDDVAYNHIWRAQHGIGTLV